MKHSIQFRPRRVNPAGMTKTMTPEKEKAYRISSMPRRVLRGVQHGRYSVGFFMPASNLKGGKK
ncbi:MAG: hypothetical protein QM680_13515 [Luteolibacter sp.]